MKPVEITDLDTFNLLVVDNRNRVLVEFYQSEGCVPCKRLAPHYEAASEKSDVPFVKVDLLDPALFQIGVEYGVMKTPTVLLMNEGVVLKEIQGRTAIQILNELE